MVSPNKRINNLVQYLPEKDRVIALRLISKRDFNSLKELIDSLIKKTEKNTESEEYKKLFESPNMIKIYELYSVIIDYLLLIGDLEEPIDDDY